MPRTPVLLAVLLAVPCAYRCHRRTNKRPKQRVYNTRLQDQVVTDGGAVGLIREKPRNHAELAEFLRTYASGGPAATVGALCVHDVATGARAVVSHVATVKFAADWPPEDIAGLLASPELRFCAGGTQHS